ncbi:MAG: FAD:protein FMN transferase [Halochromatium sp.]
MRAEARAALLLLLAALIAGCGSGEVPVYTTQFPAFGTRVDLSIVGIQRERAADAAANVERDFSFFDQVLRGHRAEHMLRINQQLPTGEPFVVPPSFIPLLTRSQTLFSASDGLFNPAMGRFFQLWGLDRPDPAADSPPDAAAIDALLAVRPTMSDLELDGIALRSDNAAVQLDFDAVATAYAMDLAVEALRAQAVRNAMINVGGDVRAIGSRSGRSWRLPVPRASGSGVIGVLDASGDASLFTASAQRRNFRHRDQLYHAVLDPRTGRPACGVLSATVLYQGDGLTAAAAAHALMIAGPEDWPRIAGRMGIDHVLLIDEDGRLQMTPAMADLITLLDTKAEQVIRSPLEPAS